MVSLRSIALELTARCNQQCVYCYNPGRHGPPPTGQEPSTAEICAVVDRILADAELEQITLTGGEPTLRDDLLAMIDHVNARGIPAAIISNGGLIDQPMARALAARRMSYVQVTLCGPEARLHDALCGPGSFRRAVAAIGNLVAAGVPVGGSFLCTRRNWQAAGDTLEAMYERGVRQHFAFNRFNPSGSAVARMAEFLPRRSEVLEALRQADGFAATRATEVHCTMPVPRCMVDEEEFPRVRFGQCAAGGQHAEYAVDPRGGVKLCTLQRRSIGSLWESSLAEVLVGGAGARFRAMIPAFCRPCPHRDECLGGCGAAAEWVFGRADELDPFLAQHVMADFAQRVAEQAGCGAETGVAFRGAKGDHAAFVDLAVLGATLVTHGIRVRIDPWYDLVYHVLAHVPLAGSDASTLLDEAYVRWYDGQLACRINGALPTRTLVADAPLIGAAYAASSRGFLLHAWPLLFDGIESFRESLHKGFAELSWPDAERGQLAGAIVEGTHPSLIELFRAALADEWAIGYPAIWQEEVLPRETSYRDWFAAQMGQLAAELPGLAKAEWVLSYPLGAHGRLLARGDAGPIIAVGVADTKRNVRPPDIAP